MVMIEVSYERMRKELGLDLEGIRKTLFDFGMELKSVDGDNLLIELTAERTDLISFQGLVRALKCYLGKSKYKDYKVQKSGLKVYVDPKNKNVRPYTVAAVVKGLRIDEDKLKEIIWVQEKLHSTLGRNRRKAAIGVYPYDRIKGPIKFTCDKPEKIKFVPLEADKEMNGREILKEHPTGVKYAHLLEGLDKYPYFIDSNGNILSMPPIINSQLTGKVTEDTKDVFIEVSGFDLKTLNEALVILVTMLADMGGKIYSVDVVYKDKKITTPILEYTKFTLDPNYVNKTLGLKLTPKQMCKLLERMMHKATLSGKKIKVVSPPIRNDIWHPIDLVDDIARAYGFGNIKPTVPKNDSIGETARILDLKDEISNLMVSAGYQEIITFALTSRKNQVENMRLKKLPLISIKDAQDSSVNCVRGWLIPEGMRFLESNNNKKYPQKVFECGFVVVPDKTKDVKSRTILHLSCLYAGTDADYSKAAETLKYLSDVLGLNLKVRPSAHPSFIDGRVGDIYHKGKKVGLIGEIHPEVLSKYELLVPVVGFELDLSEVFGESL